MNRLTEMKQWIRKHPVAVLVTVCLVVCLLTGLFFLLQNKKKQEENDRKNDEKSLYIECPKLNDAADSFLLKKGDFHVLLDTGEVGDSDIILQMLKECNVDKLQALILSHFDKDHIGGAARIIEEIPVDICYMPEGEEDSEDYKNLKNALKKTGTKVVLVTESTSITENAVTLNMEPPLSTQYEKDSDNNRSLIIEVEAAGRNLLFAGDAKEERLAEYFDYQYDKETFDFLKVPHHGRDKNEIEKILSNFVPAHALITSSVEEPEKKGVIKALKNEKVKTWLTRMDTVELRINENGMDINYSNTLEDLKEDEETTEASELEETYIADVADPVFSSDSGFYDEEFDLTIEAPEGCKIYYTLDSTTPTKESTEYEEPIHIVDRTEFPNVYSMNEHMMPFVKTKIIPNQKPIIPGYYLMRRLPEGQVDKCMVIRAIAVDEEGRTSNVITKSYFVGYNKKAAYKNMEVMSIVSEPDGLFSDENGIMVTGSTYLKMLKNGEFETNSSIETRYYMNCFIGRGKEWEREAQLEYFGGENKDLELSQKIGIRLHGNQSRVTYVHKSFNLYARKEYDGNNTFKIPFFDNGFLLDSVTLMRGNDIRNYYLIEKLNNRTMSTQQYRLVQVFLDGEYWGLYAIQERYSKEYIKLHYDVEGDEYALFDNDTKGLHVESGDEEHGMEKFKEFQKYVKETDFSDPKNYEELCTKMDMQSFLDCYCAKIYSGDFDWNWNRNLYIFYKDGKWHWITYDIDHAASYTEQSDPEVNSFWQTRTVSVGNVLSKDPFFSQFQKNKTFRKDFSMNFMDIANGIFDAKTITKDMEEFKEKYFEASMKSIKRYPLLKESIDWDYKTGTNYYTTHCDLISNFFEKRINYAPYYLRDYFKMDATLKKVTIVSDHLEGGTVTINSLKPQLEEENGWSGDYFTNYPVTVTAVAKDGWTFAGWKCEDGTLTDEKAVTTEVSFKDDVKVTACFVKNK